MKFFVDSSVLIEGLKANKQAEAIINYILEDVENEYLINDIVVSEILYILKFKKKMNLDELIENIDYFNLLETNKGIVEMAIKFVDRYELKPNDAIILASCKYYHIENLITLDSDFEIPCCQEGIYLIDTIEKLLLIFGKDAFAK